VNTSAENAEVPYLKMLKVHADKTSSASSEDLTLTDLPKWPKKVKRHPVVFVPGLTGSELWRGSERVWPNPKLFFTQPQQLRLAENNPLEARAVVGEVVLVPNLVELDRYSRLSDYLEESLGYERGKGFWSAFAMWNVWAGRKR